MKKRPEPVLQMGINQRGNLLSDKAGEFPWFLVALSIVLSMEKFLIFGNCGLNLADEGFFWYGVDHVFRGEIPVLDFHAYDPFRYYWSALLFRLWRPGILPLRFSESLVLGLGIYLALLAVRRFTKDRLELFGMGVLLALWMYPDFRYFDCAIPMSAVLMGCRLLENPSKWNCRIAGLTVSLAAFVQREHGLYLFFSFLFFLLYVSCEKGGSLDHWRDWALGLLVGFLPLLGMILFIRGFGAAYLREMIFLNLRTHSMNIGLPVPWPWKVQWLSWPPLQSVDYVILGILFLVIPFFYIAWVYRVLHRDGERDAQSRLLLVCAVVGIPYLHYVFNRADLVHLAVGISPFLIGFPAQQSDGGTLRKVFLVFLLVLSFFSVGVESRLFQFLSSKSWAVEYPIQGDRIFLERRTVGVIEGVRRAYGNVRPGEAFLIFPHLTTLYPILQVRSPLWEIYSVPPSLPDDQEDMITQAKKNNVQWAVIDNETVDGREDLRFMNASPLFWSYLQKNYDVVPTDYLPWECYLLHKKAPS